MNHRRWAATALLVLAAGAACAPAAAAPPAPTPAVSRRIVLERVRQATWSYPRIDRLEAKLVTLAEWGQASAAAPRRSEITDPVEYRSISAFAQLADALAVQRRFPKLGSYIAELELADDDPEIAITKAPEDPADSHHNLRGEPAAFLRRVRRVFPAGQGGERGTGV